MEIVCVHAAERPDCKVRSRKEEQGRRQDQRGEHDHGPGASPPGQKRGERKRGIDNARDAPIVRANDEVANEGGSGAKKNWQLWVNTSYADKSFGVYEVQPLDVVFWRFTTQEGK